MLWSSVLFETKDMASISRTLSLERKIKASVFMWFSCWSFKRGCRLFLTRSVCMTHSSWVSYLQIRILGKSPERGGLSSATPEYRHLFGGCAFRSPGDLFPVSLSHQWGTIWNHHQSHWAGSPEETACSQTGVWRCKISPMYFSQNLGAH